MYLFVGLCLEIAQTTHQPSTTTIIIILFYELTRQYFSITYQFRTQADRLFEKLVSNCTLIFVAYMWMNVTKYIYSSNSLTVY